jgi:hypothetical protein
VKCHPKTRWATIVFFFVVAGLIEALYLAEAFLA